MPAILKKMNNECFLILVTTTSQRQLNYQVGALRNKIVLLLGVNFPMTRSGRPSVDWPVGWLVYDNFISHIEHVFLDR